MPEEYRLVAHPAAAAFAPPVPGLGDAGVAPDAVGPDVPLLWIGTAVPATVAVLYTLVWAVRGAVTRPVRDVDEAT